MTDINKTEAGGTIISEELIHTALKLKEGRDDIIITRIHTSSGAENVNNYCSVGYFVTVLATVGNAQSEYKLFVKTTLGDEAKKEMHLEEVPIFHIEQQVYSEFIPAMKKLQMKKCGHVFGPAVPDYYHSTVTMDTGAIILQNYRPDDYHVLNTDKGCADYENCKLVMKEIAVFHALSWALKNDSISIPQEYPFLSGNHFVDEALDPHLEQGIKSLIELVQRRMPDDHIKESVTKWSAMDLRLYLKHLCKPVEPFAVVCHGDFHVNNMLFKYGSDKLPKSLKLIDFQYANYSVPTTDLTVFFYSSTTRATRKQHLEDLLCVYHTEFVRCLDEMNMTFPEFTFAALVDLFKQSATFGVFMSCLYIPAILCDARETLDSVLRDLPELCDEFPVVKERLFDNVFDLVEMGIL